MAVALIDVLLPSAAGTVAAGDAAAASGAQDGEFFAGLLSGAGEGSGEDSGLLGASGEEQATATGIDGLLDVAADASILDGLLTEEIRAALQDLQEWISRLAADLSDLSGDDIPAVVLQIEQLLSQVSTQFTEILAAAAIKGEDATTTGDNRGIYAGLQLFLTRSLQIEASYKYSQQTIANGGTAAQQYFSDLLQQLRLAYGLVSEIVQRHSATSAEVAVSIKASATVTATLISKAIAAQREGIGGEKVASGASANNGGGLPISEQQQGSTSTVTATAVGGVVKGADGISISENNTKAGALHVAALAGDNNRQNIDKPATVPPPAANGEESAGVAGVIAANRDGSGVAGRKLPPDSTAEKSIFGGVTAKGGDESSGLSGNAGNNSLILAAGAGSGAENTAAAARHDTAFARMVQVNAEAADTQQQPQSQPVADQVLVRIRQAMSTGANQVRIQLEPADLGRVDVRMEIAADGRTGVVVTADSRDALDALQRDARYLERALNDIGLKTGSGNINFNLRGDGGGQPQNGAEQEMAQHGNGGTASSSATAEAASTNRKDGVDDDTVTHMRLTVKDGVDIVI